MRASPGANSRGSVSKSRRPILRSVAMASGEQRETFAKSFELPQPHRRGVAQADAIVESYSDPNCVGGIDSDPICEWWHAIPSGVALEVWGEVARDALPGGGDAARARLRGLRREPRLRQIVDECFARVDEWSPGGTLLQ